MSEYNPGLHQAAEEIEKSALPPEVKKKQLKKLFEAFKVPEQPAYQLAPLPPDSLPQWQGDEAKPLQHMMGVLRDSKLPEDIKRIQARTLLKDFTEHVPPSVTHYYHRKPPENLKEKFFQAIEGLLKPGPASFKTRKLSPKELAEMPQPVAQLPREFDEEE